MEIIFEDFFSSLIVSTRWISEKKNVYLHLILIILSILLCSKAHYVHLIKVITYMYK